jgi:tRNA 2-thiouridine synthesizing protein A
MTRKALAAASPGAVMIVLASDPLAVVDIPHMCNQEGHSVDSVTRQDGHAVFRIQRKA